METPNNVFTPLDPEAEVYRHERDLPHWKQIGCTYFVTFRTVDSLPQTMLQKLNEEKKTWLRHHPPPLSDVDREQYDERFTRTIHKWLDAGHGSCRLRNLQLNELVASALRHFDGTRYELDTFVVMPNHVHALVKPHPNFDLSSILHSWKSFTSNAINRAHGTIGPFWMSESFDHAVRSWAQLEHYRKYIIDNPAKAGLHQSEFVMGQGKSPLVPM